MAEEANSTNAVTAAARRILAPLIRVLLRSGVSYNEFTDLAKFTFIEVAEKEFPIEGRKVTTSRIATITGIPRKEVARVRKLEWQDDDEVRSKRNRAAKVTSAWLRDPDFLDRKDDPLDLPFEGPVSFSELVRRHSGDIPPRAIADELMRLDAVELVDDRYRLVARGYRPRAGAPELFEILGTDSAELMETIDHNITRSEDDAPLFQAKVVYDNVPVEYIEVFRQLSGRMAQRLLEELDRWLADHDRDNNPETLGTGKARLGLGVFQIARADQSQED